MHFFHYAFSNLRLTLREFYLLQEGSAVIDGEFADLGNAFVADSYGKNFWLETGTITGCTWNLAHIRLVLIATVITVSLTMATMNKGNDALETCCVIFSSITPSITHLNFVLVPIENGILRLRRNLLPWHIE